MKTWLKRISWGLGIIALVWIGLTVWVEAEGPSNLTKFTTPYDSLQVLIVYDPDPIYNLDEQVCLNVAMGLSNQHVAATVATVKATDVLDFKLYKAVVICANTYNWAPDRSIVSFTKHHPFLRSVPVVAITVGSGSTSEASAKLKAVIDKEGIEMINAHEWWLMKPNDETRMNESNVDVANDQAYAFGQHLAIQLNSKGKI